MVYKFSICLFLICLLSFACSKEKAGTCKHCDSVEKYDKSQLPEGKLSYKAPANWSKEAAANSMRLEQYKIAANSTLSISSLAGDAVGIDANLERWKKQFIPESISQPIIKKQFNHNSIPVPHLLISGTYLESKNPFEANAEKISHENWSAYIIVAELAESTWFFKALGPTAEIKAAEERLNEFMMSLNILGV